MDTEGRVEYTQAIDADWQVPAAALSLAVTIVAFVAVLYSPAVQNRQGSVQSATDRLGQLRATPQQVQQSVGSTQQSTTPMNATGGLQAAGTAEVYEQFEGGSQL